MQTLWYQQDSGIIIEESITVQKHLGPGLFESVYEEILFYYLTTKWNLQVERQVDIPVFYDDVAFGLGFRADLIVVESVIVEIKSIEKLNNVHYKQLLTYLKLTTLTVGLLINFNEELLKNGSKRILNDYKTSNF